VKNRQIATKLVTDIIQNFT